MQTRFPALKAALELLQGDALQSHRRFCFYLIKVVEMVSLEVFFILGTRKRSEGAKSGE